MSEELTARVNLPLSPEMYRAVKERASAEGNSAVGFIRHCIVQELSKQPKMYDLEKRIEVLERALQAAEGNVLHAGTPDEPEKHRSTLKGGKKKSQAG